MATRILKAALLVAAMLVCEFAVPHVGNALSYGIGICGLWAIS